MMAFIEVNDMDLFLVLLEDNMKFQASTPIKETILDDQRDTSDGKH